MAARWTVLVTVAAFAWSVSWAAGVAPKTPLVSESVVFEEVDGQVAVEAEHFFKQTLTGVRRWYLTTPQHTPEVSPDGDPNHAAAASGGAYLEVLPDTRRSHGDKLVGGQNFINTPGKMAVLSYKVYFNTPGRYYVWARIFSTNTEDNGMHVGIDGQWPDSGQRMQWTGKQKWVWSSKQRTAKQHGGEPYKLYLDVEKAGEHVITFCMREDGTEFDKWLMTTEKKARIEGARRAPRLKRGTLPKPFPVPKGMAAAARAAETQPTAAPAPAAQAKAGAGFLSALDFGADGSGFYADRDKWLAINPNARSKAAARAGFPFRSGTFDVTLHAVGENDGPSTYEVLVGEKSIGTFKTAVASQMYEEGPRFVHTWKGVAIRKGDVIEVRGETGSADGSGHSRARWSGLEITPADGGPALARARARPQLSRTGQRTQGKTPLPRKPGPPVHGPRRPAGKGTVEISGDLKAWHKVTLTLDGPFAHELDNEPNPFTDYEMTVTFRHESGAPKYVVPGYFAADGNAANTSAECGTVWRAHLSPDKPGKWTYTITFAMGKNAAVSGALGEAMAPFNGKTGTFTVAKTDKTGRDHRGKGRLQYVGKRHLRFAETGEYFLKQGADAPENFLAYADFDGSFKTDGHKDNFVKTWKAHVRDWRRGDPSWAGGKGKGMIGALNYLASEGMNVFSFLPLNIGGDDQNAFPYVDYDDRHHMDVSRLAQWEIVFEHADRLGLYLHFKTLETENELLLDGGDLGPQRRLYYRELIARFAHHLAMNWNLGEEINNASTQQKKAWAEYFHRCDPYRHLVVIHNGANHYDLLGSGSAITGFSLQTNRPDFSNVHKQTKNYIDRSVKAGKVWVVACDEPGDASRALRPDKDAGSSHEDGRRNGLWGNLLAGGAGNEWYFGYKHAHSDLTCEDWRSRDAWWDYCRHALEFFRGGKVPFWEMTCRDNLVGNAKNDNSRYCLAKPGEVYVVYLPKGGTTELDLRQARGTLAVGWFNPRAGGPIKSGKSVQGGGKVTIGPPPADAGQDWVALIRR